MADTGLKSPTATGEDYNQWTLPTRAYTSDDLWTSEDTVGHKQDYYNFAFGVPTGATPVGIEVKLEAKYVISQGQIGCELSWDGGANYTGSGKNTGPLTGSDVIYTLGGAADLWGRAWADTEFSDANFRVRVNADAVWCLIDHIQVRVYYTEVPAGPPGVKTINDLAIASVKTINDLAITSVKTINDAA